MDRETCKALLENGVLQAYAEGREIQLWTGNERKREWTDANWCNFSQPPSSYRVKPTRVPFDANTIQPHLERWIYFDNGLSDIGATRIVSFGSVFGIRTGRGHEVSFEDLAANYKFLDTNEPCCYTLS